MQQRPRPDDFRAMFIALGWRGVIAHYGTHGRTVSRWMTEEGRADLVAERGAYIRRLQDRDRAFRRRVESVCTPLYVAHLVERANASADLARKLTA